MRMFKKVQSQKNMQTISCLDYSLRIHAMNSCSSTHSIQHIKRKAFPQRVIKAKIQFQTSTPRRMYHHQGAAEAVPWVISFHSESHIKNNQLHLHNAFESMRSSYHSFSLYHNLGYPILTHFSDAEGKGLWKSQCQEEVELELPFPTPKSVLVLIVSM